MNKARVIERSNPSMPEQPKLFLIDARHAVERKYLLDWLHSSLAEGGPGQNLNWVSLPISDERKKLQFDALAEKLRSDPATRIIPVRIAWRIPNFDKGKAVRLRHLVLGNPRLPNSFRARTILLRDKRRAHCITGEPATIGDLRVRFEAQMDDDVEQDEKEFAGFVVRQAGLVLDIVERGLRGSRYKMPRFVADGVRTETKFRADMRTLADDSGEPLTKLYETAGRYLKELVARPTPAFLDIRARFEKFLLGQGYDTDLVHKKHELDKLRQTMRDHPTLLLFTHKTYLDGLTPTQLLYQNDLPMLHLFGGINLDIFGIGALFRKSGTIFIRRSFADNKLYKLTLRHYISYLLEKRFPMSWSFEGTRSRLGKLMPPKYGLLKYVLDAAHEGNISNIHIVPFVTSFDIIRDVEEYAGEQTGRVKAPESLSWFVSYIRSLRSPMGRIFIDLGEPVIVKEAPHPDNRLALSKIAFEVSVKANEATPFTLTSLLCVALLGSAPRGMTSDELRTVIGYCLEYAKERDIRLSEDLESNALAGLQETIENLVKSGLLVRYDQGSNTVLTIEPGQHSMASYYRNSIIHHFLYKAIIELSVYKARELPDRPADEVFWEETDRLRDLFKFEFFWPERKEYRAKLEEELGRCDPEWRAKLAEGGVRLGSLANRLQPLISHAVFLPFVEAYTVVLDILTRLEPGQVINKKSMVEQALKEGRQAYMLRRITSEASIGKILFENGFRMAAGLQLVGITDVQKTEERKAVLRKFRGLSRRMEKSRIEVLAHADKIFD